MKTETLILFVLAIFVAATVIVTMPYEDYERMKKNIQSFWSFDLGR